MSATRKLGLFDSTLLVSGSMIGSGIFLVTSDMTRQLGSGPLVLLAWLLTGVITLMAALSFGELAAMMPNAGGQYNFVTRIYGKRMGFKRVLLPPLRWLLPSIWAFLLGTMKRWFSVLYCLAQRSNCSQANS
jgi:amino acid transporter